MVISGSPGAACVIQGPREFLEHRPRVWLVSQRASRFSFNAQRAYRLGDQRGVLGLLLVEEARKIRVGDPSGKQLAFATNTTRKPPHARSVTPGASWAASGNIILRTSISCRCIASTRRESWRRVGPRSCGAV